MSEPRRKPLYSFFAEPPNTGSSRAHAPKSSPSERPQPKYYNPANHTVHPYAPDAHSERTTSQAPHADSRHHPAPFSHSRRHFVPAGPAPQHQQPASQQTHQVPPSQQQPSNATGPSSANIEELTRIFNSALVSSRAESLKDFSHELLGLVESPAYQAIINAVRQLARSQGIGERESAEILIQTFRKLDRLWSDYVFQEGVDRLRGK